MLSNHPRLGENGARITSTVDNLTLYRLDILKERIAKHFGINFSAGAVVRRAVADLMERSEQWKDIEPGDKMVERRLLEAVKHAKPAPQEQNYSAQVSSDEALTGAVTATAEAGR